jgi:2-dehydro-3-deoxygluconokinase
LRNAKTATVNDWGAICFADGKFYEAQPEGCGDSRSSRRWRFFCIGPDLRLSELIKDCAKAVEYGAAHGALAMSTLGYFDGDSGGG